MKFNPVPNYLGKYVLLTYRPIKQKKLPEQFDKITLCRIDKEKRNR